MSYVLVAIFDTTNSKNATDPAEIGPINGVSLFGIFIKILWLEKTRVEDGGGRGFYISSSGHFFKNIFVPSYSSHCRESKVKVLVCWANIHRPQKAFALYDGKMCISRGKKGEKIHPPAAERNRRTPPWTRIYFAAEVVVRVQPSSLLLYYLQYIYKYRYSLDWERYLYPVPAVERLRL